MESVTKRGDGIATNAMKPSRSDLIALVEEVLAMLVGVEPNRRTGSPGNRAATAYIADLLAEFGCTVDATPFEVLDYHAGEAWLDRGTSRFQIETAPYSLPCGVQADAVVVGSVDELRAGDIAGKIVLMMGEICSEQLMPKNFPFYNPDHHREIIALLEDRKPAALITATGRNPDVGALYPYPLFVDGDFEIPNAFCTEEIGRQLAAAQGRWSVTIQGERSPATASNVLGRLNASASHKVTITAHLDAYEDSPGASDNASGVAALAAIARLLQSEEVDVGIELLAINGEDHYSAAGEKDYIARHGKEIDSIQLLVNIDDIGFVEGGTSYSTYSCSTEMQSLIRTVFAPIHGLKPGDAWYSGDHMVFVQAGRPALAFTAEKMPELMETVTHTGNDTVDLLDPGKIVDVAQAVSALVTGL